MKFDLKKSWTDYPLVAFDTETSGAYAIESEIIELGAVKWHNGRIIDKFQTLLKPSEPLKDENIRIHGITNEMVSQAPMMKDQIVGFCDFINETILIAHHAPFDLGFLALDIENQGLQFPSNIHLCTSLLSRALLPTTNHKLQTLIKELKLEGGAAHRAYDDAYACLQVFFKCADKLIPDTTLERLLSVQGKKIIWENYKIATSGDEKLKALTAAARLKKSIQIVYEGGQTKNKTRSITPLGIVRNPDGDYIHAICGIDHQRKRFYIHKILEYEL